MKAYFDRHQVDKRGRGWGVDSKGWQAWLLWGGDPGYRWAKEIVSRYKENSKKLTPEEIDALSDEEWEEWWESQSPAAASARRDREAWELVRTWPEQPIAAPLHDERYVVLIHPSTRKPGWWQGTFFEGDDPIGDTESPTWLLLLDNLQMGHGINWREASPVKP